MLLGDTEYKIWPGVKQRAGRGEDYGGGSLRTKGKAVNFHFKCVLNEVKNLGALQPFRVSNSQDTYIKVAGRR